MFLKWFYIETGLYILLYGGMIIYDLFGGNLKKKSSKVDVFTNNPDVEAADSDNKEEESIVVAETNIQEGSYNVYDPQINPYQPLAPSDDNEAPVIITEDEEGSAAGTVPGSESEPSDTPSVDEAVTSPSDSAEELDEKLTQAEAEMKDIEQCWQEMMTSAAMEAALSVNSPRRARYTVEVLSV